MTITCALVVLPALCLSLNAAPGAKLYRQAPLPPLEPYLGHL